MACVFLQLNYSHNYVLVASALKQIQSNNGNDIYIWVDGWLIVVECHLFELLTKDTCPAITVIEAAF